MPNDLTVMGVATLVRPTWAGLLRWAKEPGEAALRGIAVFNLRTRVLLHFAQTDRRAMDGLEGDVADFQRQFVKEQKACKKAVTTEENAQLLSRIQPLFEALQISSSRAAQGFAELDAAIRELRVYSKRSGDAPASSPARLRPRAVRGPLARCSPAWSWPCSCPCGTSLL